MIYNFNKYDDEVDKFMNELYEKGLISSTELDLEELEPDVLSVEKMTVLLTKPMLLDVVDDELCVTIDGTVHKIGINSNITSGKTKISTILPEFNFDIDQDGNISRQLEVESIYKCIIVSKVFVGLYDDDVKDIISRYDTKKMCTNDANYPFSTLLKEIQEESTYLMKLLLGACNIVIAKYTSKNISTISAMLTPEERSSVDALRTKIKSEMFKLQTEIDSERNAVDKRMLIYKKDAAIRTIINESKICDIYNIVNLSTECLPFSTKLKVSRLARKMADTYVDSDVSIKDEVTREIVKRNLRTRLRRRGHRVLLSEWKRSEYTKYKNDPSYVIRLKR